MKNSNPMVFIFIMVMSLFLAACSAASGSEPSGSLEKNETYIGLKATKEIIEVESDSSWKIKSANEDDTNFTVVSVEETGELIGELPVVKLIAEEVSGDISSTFAKREGRSFIYIKDGDEVFFRSIADENRESIASEIEKVDDPVEYIKEIANFKFTKQ